MRSFKNNFLTEHLLETPSLCESKFLFTEACDDNDYFPNFNLSTVYLISKQSFTCINYIPKWLKMEEKSAKDLFLKEHLS